MKNLTQLVPQLLLPRFRSLIAQLSVAVILMAFSLPLFASGAALKARISGEVSSSQMTQLPGSKIPAAAAQFESGRVAAGTRLEGISLYFNRSEQQNADLQSLIAAQQDPSSPLYHQWLTPEQFGARFGVADGDIAKVEGWLEQQGFAIDSVSRSRNMIRFSGTVAQVEAAFATEMHHYTSNGVTHMAPSTALSVPSALAGVVLGIRNLDDFKPRPHFVSSRGRAGRPKPNFTGYDGSLFFAPGDVAEEYDIQKAYNAGFNGEGQTITLIGQSQIENSDIENFESASGLPVKDPTSILVPNSGGSVIQADGDETESDIDIEWSGAIARGADIEFVYTGSNVNYSAFDSIQYAIDNKIGTIISSSYGECEAELAGETLGSGAALQSTLEAAFQQAEAQGQTVLSAAGDDGATDCYGETNFSTSQQDALAVDYPGSSAYVTSVGGTEISQANAAYLTPGDGYWSATNTSSDTITSVLQYIPEQAWNEDEAGCGQSDCLGAGGGGASALFSKPSWQTALTPADGHRDVPDVSLNASVNYPGYLFCTSDQSDWSNGQEASCNDGFRDKATGDPTWAGGTSFAAPIFAGMIAIINQQQGYSSGQGFVNATLYSLAGNAATYASAFHDITSGNNDCPAGQGACSSTVTGFAAKTGYDQVTGLGTVDFFNLAAAWPASTAASLIGTTTTVTASNNSPTINTSDTFTISVVSDTGTTTPTGTVTITVDGGTPVTETLASNGTYVYTTSFSTVGTHTILVQYSGDATHASSTPGDAGSAFVTVGGTSSGSGTFSLGATNVTVAQGSTGISTITVTPAGGYTGTVDLSFDTSNDSALENLCYGFTNTLSNGDGTVTVTGTGAVTTQLALDTNASDCNTAVAVKKTGKHSLRSLRNAALAQHVPDGPSGNGDKGAPAAIAFAGLLLAGFVGRYSKKLRTLAGVIALAAVGLAISACGGSSNNTTTISDPPKGTYTITLTGQDSSSASIPTASTTFSFTIN